MIRQYPFCTIIEFKVIIKPDGKVEPVITGIDAADVVFDTEGIPGGGMFVGDTYNPWGAPEYPSSKVWRFVPK